MIRRSISRVIILSGEAGSGKSSLLADIIENLREQGIGTDGFITQAVPGGIWSDALKNLLASAPPDVLLVVRTALVDEVISYLGLKDVSEIRITGSTSSEESYAFPGREKIIEITGSRKEKNELLELIRDKLGKD